MPYMDGLNAMDIVLVVLVAEGQGHRCSCTGRASPFNFIFSQVCKKVDVINVSIYFLCSFCLSFVCQRLPLPSFSDFASPASACYRRRRATLLS